MTPAHGIAIDDRDPACIVVRWPSRRVGARELELFAEDVVARLGSASAPARVMVDVRGAAPLEPAALASLGAIDRRVCASGAIAARAIVVPGVVAARVVALAIAAARPRVPTRAFPTPEAARAWLDEASSSSTLRPTSRH